MLSRKMRVFVAEYLKDWNATQAAVRAGYSRKTAHSIGSENLRKPEIAAAISAEIAARAMGAEETLARLAEQARASLGRFLKVGPDGFASVDLSDVEHHHLLKRYKARRSRRIDGRGEDAVEWEDEYAEIELVDAQGALIAIGRHHQLFTERLRIEQSLTVLGIEKVLDLVYGGSDDAGNDPGE